MARTTAVHFSPSNSAGVRFRGDPRNNDKAENWNSCAKRTGANNPGWVGVSWAGRGRGNNALPRPGLDQHHAARMEANSTTVLNWNLLIGWVEGQRRTTPHNRGGKARGQRRLGLFGHDGAQRSQKVVIPQLCSTATEWESGDVCAQSQLCVSCRNEAASAKQETLPVKCFRCPWSGVVSRKLEAACFPGYLGRYVYIATLHGEHRG